MENERLCRDCISYHESNEVEPCKTCLYTSSLISFVDKNTKIKAEVERLTQALHDEHSNCCTISGELNALGHDYNTMKEDKEKQISRLNEAYDGMFQCYNETKNLLEESCTANTTFMQKMKDLEQEIAFLKGIINKLIKE